MQERRSQTAKEMTAAICQTAPEENAAPRCEMEMIHAFRGGGPSLLLLVTVGGSECSSEADTGRSVFWIFKISFVSKY